MLKHATGFLQQKFREAATFGWLCVETCVAMADATSLKQPPSGGCVLKPVVFALHPSHNRAATFGWLCVETLIKKVG